MEQKSKLFQSRRCLEMRRRWTESLLGIWTGCRLSAQRSFFVQDFSFSLFLICLKVVRIFTSSTFTDMLMERNTLMEYVYPKIKEYCREKHGLEYQVWKFWIIQGPHKKLCYYRYLYLLYLYLSGCGHAVGRSRWNDWWAHDNGDIEKLGNS